MRAVPLGKEALSPRQRPTDLPPLEGFPRPFPRGGAKCGEARGLPEGTESHFQDWTQQGEQEEGNWASPGPCPSHTERTYHNIPSTEGTSSSPVTRVGSGARRSQGTSSRPRSVTKQLQDCRLQASAIKWCLLPPRCDGEIKSVEEHERG